MRGAGLGAVGLLVAAMLDVSPAAAQFPLTGTLPQEQNLILRCTVSDTLTAENCDAPPGTPPSPHAKDFVRWETEGPDHLVGAARGDQVWLMVRRSAAAAPDNANPGRAAAPRSPRQPAVTAPDWEMTPNSADLGGYYPDYALLNSISGGATVQCTVGSNGDLLGCWIAAENSPDIGFGWSALILSTFVKMRPADTDGAPTSGRAFSLRADFSVNVQANIPPQVTLSTGL